MMKVELVQYHGQTIELKRIHLAGKDRPVAFVMYTYTLFKRQTGIDFLALKTDDQISYEEVMRLYHCALVVGSMIVNEEFDIPFEPDFQILCNSEVMQQLAGMRGGEGEEEEEEEVKNDQSHSRSKKSKKSA